MEALERLKGFFSRTLPPGVLPQVVFHGAEPLLNRDAVFAGIERFHEDFRFGLQTNATLLDDAAIAFLTGHGVSIGLSLDGATHTTAGRTRKTWAGQDVTRSVVSAMEGLRGYGGWSVICTVTSKNMRHLTRLVEFFHEREVPTCLMNVVRCTLPRSREIKPDDRSVARHLIAALDRTRDLYRETGRKLTVANFANVLLAIVAPSARRLMCDISPCGGGRCFFALVPSGDLFACSEFIGLPVFKGGNLFHDSIDDVLVSAAFQKVTSRKAEDIEPCSHCAIRHFCGAPCPAEAHGMNGGMQQRGAFCGFYEEQVRYAFRVIADDGVDDYLWDGWDRETKEIFRLTHVC
jgi:uncharacterized protein